LISLRDRIKYRIEIEIRQVSEIQTKGNLPVPAARSTQEKTQGQRGISGIRGCFLLALLLFPFTFFGSVVLDQCTVSAMDITLAWDANTETDLAGYKIYYGTTSGCPYNGKGSSDGDSPIVVPRRFDKEEQVVFTVHGLPRGSYCFVATAYNTEGFESCFSNEVCACPPPSPAPFLLLLLSDND
jgi:hypothetical protein